MRGPLATVSLLFVATLSGCFGLDTPVTAPSTSGSTGPDGAQNQVPLPVIRLASGDGTSNGRYYVGENLTASADGSQDPDGSIANYTWRLLRNGSMDAAFGERHGVHINFSVTSPGDRALSLQVRDDLGASESQLLWFGVNQRRVETGTLLFSPNAGLPGGVGVTVGVTNFSLPIAAGILALSVHANFKQDSGVVVRIEIHAPNGTLLNRSESARSPLWAIAAPSPGVVGNYTAHLSLVAGVGSEYRMEFVGWYGYS